MKEQLEKIQRKLVILKRLTRVAIVMLLVINILLWGKFMEAYDCLLLGSIVFLMYILIQRAELGLHLMIIAFYDKLTEEQEKDINLWFVKWYKIAGNK